MDVGRTRGCGRARALPAEQVFEEPADGVHQVFRLRLGRGWRGGRGRRWRRKGWWRGWVVDLRVRDLRVHLTWSRLWHPGRGRKSLADGLRERMLLRSPYRRLRRLLLSRLQSSLLCSWIRRRRSSHHGRWNNRGRRRSHGSRRGSYARGRRWSHRRRSDRHLRHGRCSRRRRSRRRDIRLRRRDRSRRRRG